MVSKFIIETIIHKHGCPHFILTDNATNFTSFVLPRLNENMSIRGVFSTPYHPESIGMVERVNGTLERILRKITIERPSKWATFLSSAVFAYNIGYNLSTGHSPFKMLYGRQPSLPPILYTLVKDTDNKNPLDYVEKLFDTLIEI